MQIGEVAANAGVSIDTVRYYERQRLLKPARRSSGGFRLFTQDAVERIRFIKQAQDIGLSLEEIRALLITAGGAAQCQRVHDLLKAKLSELDERMRAMRQFRGTLTRYKEACERELRDRGRSATCPVIVNLSSSKSKRKNERS
ncbi:MAG TPA: heavy metal-responsive transcriptional regulator [Blastocatellia bacterium]|nr:heavy metal-responsive transcriptional regulator [Blastocatellia bacterium]